MEYASKGEVRGWWLAAVIVEVCMEIEVFGSRVRASMLRINFVVSVNRLLQTFCHRANGGFGNSRQSCGVNDKMERIT